jgi:Fe-S cluster assembly iron-binding protein IscA
MLTLTPNAESAVRFMSARFGAAGVRISSPLDSEPGEYTLELVTAPEDYDVRVEQGGANVFLDLLTSLELDALALDARIDDNGAAEFGVVAP